ncbi:MAG: TonB-dependent receptor plug domain-containing protein, partial [Sphingomonadales bacterium]|nr:TonB-dependent receptor plug domain-containing protein [Sphingomonadales bacterium]
MTKKFALRATTALTALCVSATFEIAPVAAQDQDIDTDTLEQVTITGTFIRRKGQADSASPISVLGSEDLSAIGAQTVADITQTLTINTGAENSPDAFTQNGTTGTESINLRGLGLASTLILLNGKRQVVSGGVPNTGVNFVDTASLVPSIAIDRIDILKDGAAALYGSDAVAGVVNFFTRDNFEGLELSADYRAVAGTGDSSDIKIQGLVGGGNDRAHVIAAVSYLDRS